MKMQFFSVFRQVAAARNCPHLKWSGSEGGDTEHGKKQLQKSFGDFSKKEEFGEKDNEGK